MISVCIASYNGEKFIKEQLQSILVQLEPDDEVIVSDDNSVDGTLDIIKEFEDSRIRIFLNEKEKGYSQNFENSIRQASGDIIFICDQDDVWMKNKVELMKNALSNSSLAIHNASIVDSNLNLINSKTHFELYQVRKGFLMNFLRTRYIGACMAFKREILEKALPFPVNQKLCAYDYWLTLVAEYYYKVELVQDPLIKYRRHFNNASTGGVKSKNSLLKKIKMRSYSLYHLFKR